MIFILIIINYAFVFFSKFSATAAVHTCHVVNLWVFKCLCTKHVDSDFDHSVPSRTLSVDDVSTAVVQFALRDHNHRGCVSGVDLIKQHLVLEITVSVFKRRLSHFSIAL